jgi:hypothetical protein
LGGNVVKVGVYGGCVAGVEGEVVVDLPQGVEKRDEGGRPGDVGRALPEAHLRRMGGGVGTGVLRGRRRANGISVCEGQGMARALL